MQELSNYISEKYTYEDICNLQSLLDDIKKKKIAERDSKYCFANFYDQYINYIKATFSPAYLKSVKLSFNHLMSYIDYNTETYCQTCSQTDNVNKRKCFITENVSESNL